MSFVQVQNAHSYQLENHASCSLLTLCVYTLVIVLLRSRTSVTQGIMGLYVTANVACVTHPVFRLPCPVLHKGMEHVEHV